MTITELGCRPVDTKIVELMMLALLAIIIATSALSGCQSTAKSPWPGTLWTGKNPINHDNVIDENLGTISQHGEVICTAFIAAPREIITAANCIRDDLDTYVFRTISLKQSSPLLYERQRYKNASLVTLAVNALPIERPNSGTISSDNTLRLINLAPKSLNTIAVIPKWQLSENGRILFITDQRPQLIGGLLMRGGSAIAVHVGSISSRQHVAVDLNHIGDANANELALTPDPCLNTLGNCPQSTRKSATICGYTVPIKDGSNTHCRSALTTMEATCPYQKKKRSSDQCPVQAFTVASLCSISKTTTKKIIDCCLHGGC